jgi:Bacterial TSP3 repeat
MRLHLPRASAALLISVISILSSAAQVWATAANVWHIPDNLEINSGSTHMRDPWVEISHDPANPTTITIYQGIFKGNGENEMNGGLVYYKGQSQANWSSAPLNFFTNSGSNQYWSAQFSTAGIDTNHANDVIQYYIYVATDNSAGFGSTYLYAPSGGGDHGGYATVETTVTNAQNTAAASPFTVRDRAGWIFHADNRVVTGTSVQFWAKVGYVSNVNDNSTRWVTNGTIYYTTDGTTPVPSPTTPGSAGNGSTQVANFTYDHPDNSNSQNGGSGSIAGTPMWWVASVGNLPTFTTINYKVGFWNPANNEQKFGDYNAGDGTNYQGHVFSFSIGTLGDPVLTVASVNNGTLNGNYTTSHVFVDEIAGDLIPLNIVFQPNAQNVDPTTVQIYTNLNRRDSATLPWTDSFGIATEEGINPPSGDVVGTNDNHYYKAYAMTDSGDHLTFTLALNAQKTGAYRLTARYRLQNSATWNYYTTSGRRDHAIVVSPKQSRNIQLYELDTLNINAVGDQPGQRGTFADLMDSGKSTRATGAALADLNYIKNLGCTWLWFQPVHPNGIDGRETDPSTSQPYTVGSPYSVKNFFEIMPLMSPDSANFTGGTDPTANDTAAGRVQAKQSFHDFVVAADNAGLGVMLDAPFNHSSWDAEFAPASTPSGIANLNNLINPGSNPTDQIRNKEARFYSLSGDYALRASGAANVALAPDRGDFGKWPDVHDIYFGTYSALVDVNPNDNGFYNNESDQFFGYFGSAAYPNGDPNWTSADFNFNGSNYNITRDIWKYFAQYVPYWLSQTGHVDGSGNLVGNSTNANPAQRLIEDNRGIDGLRADFGQGLPPQCWEYIINVARSYKWDFVFMTESLDGGAVTYRSNRHFDILNENIIFPLQSASQTSDYRSIFDQRRIAYGQGLVLLNNMSHDEQAYTDPFQAVIRFAAASTIDGAPMVFYGQENGISQTFGFDHYETNFGKQIAHFKRFNDLGLILGNETFGLQQLYPVIAAINQARQFSAALRSSNRFYLNQTDSSIQQSIFSIAKYQTANVSPGLSDVVLGFVNLDRNNTQSGNYNVNITQNGSNLFGINPGRTYNVKNISAYTGQDPNRRNYFLWNGNNGFSGSTVLNNGVFVSLNPVPSTNAGWTTNPYEAQYLKLYDISAPNTPSPQGPHPYAYAIGNSVTFTWSADPNVNPSYTVTVTVNGGTPFTVTTTGTSYTYTGNFGDQVTITVTATNQDSSAPSGTSSPASVKLLDPNGDADGDGMTNAAEDTAGTNPLDPNSVFRVTSVTSTSVTWSSVQGKKYHLDMATAAGGPYSPVGSDVVATGPTSMETISASAPAFYRVRIVP